MAKSQIDSVANCPMNGVLLSGRIEKVFCVLVVRLWFAWGFSARALSKQFLTLEYHLSFNL
jgi:hypothetical protein